MREANLQSRELKVSASDYSRKKGTLGRMVRGRKAVSREKGQGGDFSLTLWTCFFCRQGGGLFLLDRKGRRN